VEFHEAAKIFPMMTVTEYDQLKADISANGLLEPIVIYNGLILDGRNRYLACTDLGITPEYETFDGDDPVSFVISKNLHRRHLNETQRAVVASKLANMPKHLHKTDMQICISQPEAAEKLNVSTRSVATIKEIERKAPELMPKLESGEMTANEAIKIIKNQKREKDIAKQVTEIKANNYKPPERLYEVIVIDPPWPYGTKYDANARRAANPYPEMSLDEIKAIKLPSANDCILWLWTTHKFMRYSFDLLDEWGFRDVAILTWCKSKMGLGEWLRSQSEFCIMAVKGKPKVNLTNQTTVLYAPMREHSRKPDEFYSMVDALCVGYKIDWFSREHRDGWDAIIQGGFVNGI
jgi:N6-adenosine-specific RNA methylase IME4